MSSLLTRLKITLGTANADAHALAMLEPDYKSSVSQGKDLVFAPGNNNPQTGIIFYSGGRCDPRAYAPLLRPLAATGNLVIVPHMPLRLAVLDSNRASKIMAAYPEVQRWIIGGHSMGGAIATVFAHKHATELTGLFLLGSYPPAMAAMPTATLRVLMINASQDFITNAREVAAAPQRLPANSRFEIITGGDHYQFGSFAGMPCTATLSRDEQQQQTRRLLQGFINTLPY